MITPVHSPLALGRALRDARRSKGWTQKDLANLAGIGQPTISNVERGSSNVSLATLLRLLSILGVELVVRDAPSVDGPAFWEAR